MKKIPILSTLLLLISSCVGMRRAQTGIRRAFSGPVTQEFSWGEVYCGQGSICSEIDVTRVDYEDRDGGTVEVTMENRTGDDLQVQIQLEILNSAGARLDRSTFQSVGIPASQEAVWSMPGIYKKGAKIRVTLRRV